MRTPHERRSGLTSTEADGAREVGGGSAAAYARRSLAGALGFTEYVEDLERQHALAPTVFSFFRVLGGTGAISCDVLWLDVVGASA